MCTIEKPLYRLVLHPQNAGYAPESSDIIQTALEEVGFIGESCFEADSLVNEESQCSRFLVGEQFLQLLSFMGCSPNINLAPTDEADRDFCHVALSSVYPQSQFRAHERDVFARCPECGRRDTNWKIQIERWQVDNSLNNYVCPHCNKGLSLYDLRWRQLAGFGRVFIDVFSIFPQEGIPTDKLLSHLEKVSGQSWTYFFTNR